MASITSRRPGPACASAVSGVSQPRLPDEIAADCDELATIPLAEGAESLNVATAGAIALYERRRQTS